uniref:ABC transporter permease n=1 Tax=Archaeoglobus fulgidus TaxID=2234 RepID=A0A7J2TG44_ARCFL
MKALTVVSIFIFLFFWEIFYWIFIKDPFLFSPPSRVFPTFFNIMTGRDPSFYLPADIIYSLYHYFHGFSVAVMLGVSLGLLMGYSKKFEALISPIIEILRPIPPIAWIPIAILLLKLTHAAAAFIIFIGSFFPVLINTRSGVANVEIKYIEAAMTLGAKKSDILRKVVIPSAMPSIFTGIRVGSGVAWMCVVAAELFGVSAYGLGYQIEIARLYHAPEVVLSYMLSIGLIGFLLDRFYRILEHSLMKWRRGLVVE